MEDQIAATGKKWADLSQKDMNNLWEAAKKSEKKIKI